MPLHSGIQRVEWDFCDRCGFEYPITQLITQKGLKVCTKTCFDKTLVEERQIVIAAVLDNDTEGSSGDETERLSVDDSDLRFF